RAPLVLADGGIVGLLVADQAERVVLGGAVGVHGGEAADQLALQVGPLGVGQGDRGGHADSGSFLGWSRRGRAAASRPPSLASVWIGAAPAGARRRGFGGSAGVGAGLEDSG